jgi:hypothetical protein
LDPQAESIAALCRTLFSFEVFLLKPERISLPRQGVQDSKLTPVIVSSIRTHNPRGPAPQDLVGVFAPPHCRVVPANLFLADRFHDFLPGRTPSQRAPAT